MTWMLYGANGYTGELVAKLAVERGERPLLAGRSAAKIVPLAERLGLDYVVVDLADHRALRAAITDLSVVAHCAGPFVTTSAPMVDACLDTGTHYLDLNGQVDVFESIYSRHDEAEQAEVVLLPGAGFDVVPSDCLAAMLAAALPEAAELELAFTMGGGVSPGTVKTLIEDLGGGGRARIDGRLETVELGHRHRVADFPSGPKQVTSIPWGDLSSAYRSTRIPTITTYTVVPGGDMIGRGQQILGPLLRLPAVQKAGTALVERFIHGPTDDRQARGRAELWGRVRHTDGRAVTGTLTTPAGYALSADAVVRAVGKLVAGGVRPGAHTPSSAFGADFVRELDGVRLGDDLPPQDQPQEQPQDVAPDRSRDADPSRPQDETPDRPRDADPSRPQDETPDRPRDRRPETGSGE